MTSEKDVRLGAVIPAGGSAARFGGDKLFRPLHGRPLFLYSVIAFLELIPERNLFLAVPSGEIDRYRRTLEAFLPSSGTRIGVVAGGETRTESVLHGLEALPESVEIVSVHDAARPLVTPELIRKCYEMCRLHGGAVAASPVADTMKLLRNGRLVQGSLVRSELMAVQTPQTFFRAAYLAALKQALLSGRAFTDDAGVMETFGQTEAVPVESGTPNFKITYPDDLERAEQYFSAHPPHLSGSL